MAIVWVQAIEGLHLVQHPFALLLGAAACLGPPGGPWLATLLASLRRQPLGLRMPPHLACKVGCRLLMDSRIITQQSLPL